MDLSLVSYYAGSIYVRVYEDRIDLLRAAIVGPSGTPYHDGLFFFDVRFPPEYPRCPPVCWHFTPASPYFSTLSPPMQSLNKKVSFNTWRKMENYLQLSNHVGISLSLT